MMLIREMFMSYNDNIIHKFLLFVSVISFNNKILQYYQLQE